MKTIKTAEEVYKQSWNLMANGELKEPAIIHAMRTYAEQFIDAAAERAQIDCDYLPARDRMSYWVDKNSILKLKEFLK